MKRLIIGSVAAMFALVTMAAMAEEQAAAPAAAAPAVEKPAKAARAAKAQMALQEITAIGKVSKEEKTMKNKKGEEVKAEHYMLTDADGAKIILPAGHATKKAPAPYNLDTFVDKTVKVVGKGTVMEKNGKKHVMIRVIESITEEGAAPAAAEEKK